MPRGPAPEEFPSEYAEADWPEYQPAPWPEAAGDPWANGSTPGQHGDTATNGAGHPRVNGRPTGRPALPSPAWTSEADAGQQPHGRGAFRTNG
jgi:hypothetical protein